MFRPPDDAAYSELVHAWWPRLYRTAYLLLGDAAEAEDLVQTALAKTWATWPKVRDLDAAPAYARATMVTTLSPCDMCTGAILLYKIPRVIIGENQTFYGAEDLLRSRGVEVTVLDDPECVAMMTAFIAERPALWHEDIGVPD